MMMMAGEGRLYCIVLYLYIYIALLAVHTNQKRFQCERPREKREVYWRYWFRATSFTGALLKSISHRPGCLFVPGPGLKPGELKPRNKHGTTFVGIRVIRITSPFWLKRFFDDAIGVPYSSSPGSHRHLQQPPFIVLYSIYTFI